MKRLSTEFATTILITTHDMEEANELCQRLSIMNSGKIAATGSPEDLKRTVDVDILTKRVREGKIPSTLPTEIGTLSKIRRQIA